MFTVYASCSVIHSSFSLEKKNCQALGKNIRTRKPNVKLFRRLYLYFFITPNASLKTNTKKKKKLFLTSLEHPMLLIAILMCLYNISRQKSGHNRISRGRDEGSFQLSAYSRYLLYCTTEVSMEDNSITLPFHILFGIAKFVYENLNHFPIPHTMYSGDICLPSARSLLSMKK